MPITTTQAQTSIKNLMAESAALSPSALVTLFEIDVTNVVDSLQINDNNPSILRFHNNVKLLNTSIYWGGNEYVGAPLIATGFETTSKGILPTPKIAISVNNDAALMLAILKDKIRQFGDIVGAKVTRIRTFAKFLDSRNFSPAPSWNTPDPNSEMPRDIYFIDRKSNENKLVLEFELASILDIEGVEIPRRTIYANRCNWTYRGEGCLYCPNALRNTSIHGDATLPSKAPPVATENNEIISDLIGVTLTDCGAYDKERAYIIGNFVYITKNGINYFFVCREGNIGVVPPNTRYWYQDICSKTINGCNLRWGKIGNGFLNFGGFAGADKVS